MSRLDEPDGAGLGNTHRLHMRSAVLWAVGTIEADLGRQSALDRAAAIESNPLFALSALQLRCMYMLVRGDRASAERYREQAELLQIQNCPPQMFQGTQLLRLSSYYAAIGDLLRVKLCVTELEAMARDHPAWRPIAHYGRGAYQTLRGDHAQAQAELEQGLALMSAGNHVNWAACAGALLAVLVRLEGYQEAVERGRLWIASVHSQQLQVAVHPLLVPVALAEGCLGQADAAVRHIREAIDVLSAEQGGGVLLGEAFEVHARIALQMADAETFERCAKACETEFRFGSHPALLARLERLHRRAYEAGLVLAPAPHTSTERRVPSFDEIQTNVSTLLRSARASGERAERALRLIGDASHCNAGFLYLIKPTGPTLVAQVGGAVPWADMDEAVKGFLESSHESDVTQSTVSGSPDLRTFWSIDESTCFMPMLLSHTADRSVYVTGVAVMAIGSGKSVYPPARLLQVLSKSLSDAGDVVTQHTAQLRPCRIHTTGHASLRLGASPSLDFVPPVPGNPITRQLDMTNPHPWLDVSAYPILVVRYPANADRPEAAGEVQEFYDAFCAWADSHQAPYTVIADTTAIKTIPSALVRAAVAKGEARTAEFEARLNKGTAVIVTNAITRGVATAVFWLSPPAYPMRLFVSFDDALAWILTKLDGAGLPRPPTLPHAI